MTEYIYVTPSFELSEMVKKEISIRRATLSKLGCALTTGGSESIESLDIINICTGAVGERTYQLEVTDFNSTDVDITIAIRNPRKMILDKFWMSYQKSHFDVQEFIDEEIENRSLFLSEIHQNYITATKIFRFLPIDSALASSEARHPIFKLLYESTKSAIKFEPDVVERMYTAMLTKEARAFLIKENSVGSSSLEDNSVKRIELVALKSRPFFEYSRGINCEQLKDCGALLDIKSPALEHYFEEWNNDAHDFLLNKENNEENDFLKKQIEFYKKTDKDSILIPSNNFLGKLPINADWSVIVRIIAAAI